MADTDAVAVRALLDMSDELLEMVGLAALAADPRAALHFGQTCRGLHTKLERVRGLVESRRLRWLPEMTAEHAISDHGRSLTCTRLPRMDDVLALQWATGGLLPSQGMSIWTVRVVSSMKNDGNGMWIGVCDAAARWSWGLFLYSGRLRRICRDDHGKVDFESSPIEGFPNGNYMQVIQDAEGRPGNLRGKATGALIEVLVDHEIGTLSFRIDGGPRFVALSPQDEDAPEMNRGSGVFPPGAALRPYASCYYPGDSLRFESPWAYCTTPVQL